MHCTLQMMLRHFLPCGHPTAACIMAVLNVNNWAAHSLPPDYTVYFHTVSSCKSTPLRSCLAAHTL